MNAQERIYTMRLAKVYPLWVAKAERKGRTKSEVDEVICWLTRYTPEELENQIQSDITLESFFGNSPELNPNRIQIKGSVCGIKVQDIKDPIVQLVRYTDKLVDEIAQGKPIQKILRSG